MAVSIQPDRTEQRRNQTEHERPGGERGREWPSAAAGAPFYSRFLVSQGAYHIRETQAGFDVHEKVRSIMNSPHFS